MANLPSGYIELEYIESTGTQYIDTEFKPNQNTRIISEIELVETPDVVVGIFGARKAWNEKNYSLSCTTTPSYRSDYNTLISQNFSGNILQEKITVDKNKNVTTIGTQTLSYSSSSFQCEQNLMIFCWNQNGTPVSFSKIKLYSFKLYDNDELILDLIPCKTNTGAIGLYNIINNLFYANPASESLIAGPEINKPNIYVKINNIWQPVTGIYTKTNNTW